MYAVCILNETYSRGDLKAGEKNFAAGYIPLIDHQ